MCREDQKDGMVRLLFRHTTTIGIRENRMHRYILDRKEEPVETPYGTIRKKTVSGYEVERSKYEYDDLARIAKEQGRSLYEIRKAAEEADDKHR